MENSFQPTWDLKTIFPGGSKSKEFHQFLKELEEELHALLVKVEGIEVKQGTNLEQVDEVINTLGKVMKKFRESQAFISCLTAQDITDQKARLLVGKRSELQAEMNTILTSLEQKFSKFSKESWKKLLKDERFEEIAYILDEYRTRAKTKQAKEQEILISDLAIDGYQGWSQMYDTIVSRMSIVIDRDGKEEELSINQAENLLSHPDHRTRKKVFNKISETWSNHIDLFSQTLNHLAGFRLQTYKHRGWDDVLFEPLMNNRMKKETLDVMWAVIKESKQPFIDYLQQKATLLGVDQLSIYDIHAPLKNSVHTLSYTEGANFILQHFKAISPKMAKFSEELFKNRWIEAEDRANKRPGGFCTSFPYSKQTRIFMTYSGTMANVTTLAHELGHAYHQHIMHELHPLNQRYAMNVAETASTFAEMIVSDAAVQRAQDSSEKIALLDEKIQRSIAFFMDIHARFMFEENFYEERKKGLVPAHRLNELMEEAQREAYGDSLKEYNPTFWASKLHFHKTNVPFYNFPYTFGYLFSLGIYAKAKEEHFEEKYTSLLRDTGRMTVEDLAWKHLDVDLTKPEFWEDALKICIQDVKEFFILVKK